jgi:hypothetical protein
MSMSGNVATPFTAATEVEPRSVVPLGFVPMKRVTVAAEAVGLLQVSRIETATGGTKAVPATTCDGCTEKRSFAAVPGVTSKGVLVAELSEAAVAASV